MSTSTCWRRVRALEETRRHPRLRRAGRARASGLCDFCHSPFLAGAARRKISL
ncbi:hypothetical protein BaraCB756_10005 [Bradyrhizobium arachidis]|nr:MULTISPECIES: hypothetical protein [Bradyrhizobium]UFW51299.1 hypothetical protein BaraCB756_10005 [Bradyrhizobium arachidis]